MLNAFWCDLAEVAFKNVGIEIERIGNRVEEKNTNKSVYVVIVEVDPKFLCPEEDMKKIVKEVMVKKMFD